MRFLLCVSTAKVATLFRSLEAGGFTVDVVPGDLPDEDPTGRLVVFAPLPSEMADDDDRPCHQYLVADLLVDAEARVAHRGGTAVELGRREFDLLVCLARDANRVISRDALRSMVWGDVLVSQNTIEVHISSLRRKLEQAVGGRYSQAIHTVRGAGYILRTPAPPDRRSEAFADEHRLLKVREAAVARREAVLLATRLEQTRRAGAPPSTMVHPSVNRSDHGEV